MKERIDPRGFDPRLDEVVAFAFGGWHHVNCRGIGTNGTKKFARVSVHSGQLSTFDFDILTKLVLICHKTAVRAEIVQSGPNMLGIWLHVRVPDDGSGTQSWSVKHPTLAQLRERIERMEKEVQP